MGTLHMSMTVNCLHQHSGHHMNAIGFNFICYVIFWHCAADQSSKCIFKIYISHHISDINDTWGPWLNRFPFQNQPQPCSLSEPLNDVPVCEMWLSQYNTIYSVSQKSSPRNFLRYFHLWWTCVTENYRGYCPNIFLCLPVHQFWSIYLNICMNCITFTSKTLKF